MFILDKVAGQHVSSRRCTLPGTPALPHAISRVKCLVQVESLQQQLTETTQAADAAKVEAASLRQQAQAAEDSCQEAVAALQQGSLHHSQVVQHLQSRLEAAHRTLQEAPASAATVCQEQQQSIAALQLRLDQALQQAESLQRRDTELSETVQQLSSQLGSAQRALSSHSDASRESCMQLQGQVDVLQQQLAASAWGPQDQLDESAAAAASSSQGDQGDDLMPHLGLSEHKPFSVVFVLIGLEVGVQHLRWK